MTRAWLTVLVLLMGMSTARADGIRVPRLELGGAVSGLAPIVAEAPYFVVGVGPRLTVNAARWLGLEIGVEKLGPAEGSRITALYLTQIRIPLRRANTRTLSLTVGAAGLAWYRQRSEARITRLDGSIVVHPAYRTAFVDPPNLPTVGVAHDAVVHRRAAVSFAAQAMFGEASGLAIRGSLGVSFGSSGYR